MSTGSEDRCPENKDGPHVPDWYTLTTARDTLLPYKAKDKEWVIVDVSCRHCGRSGSAMVDSSTITW